VDAPAGCEDPATSSTARAARPVAPADSLALILEEIVMSPTLRTSQPARQLQSPRRGRFGPLTWANVHLILAEYSRSQMLNGQFGTVARLSDKEVSIMDGEGVPGHILTGHTPIPDLPFMIGA
jgi:hypothetical protein